MTHHAAEIPPSGSFTSESRCYATPGGSYRRSDGGTVIPRRALTGGPPNP